jgi:photosystem II stability/assembly factor-like uncharacterized protein
LFEVAFFDMQFCSQPQQHEYVESPFVPLLVLLPICLSLANCSKKRESMPIFGRHLHGVWLRGDSEVWAVGNDGFIVYSNNGGTTWQLQVSGTIEALQFIYGRGSELWTLGVGGTILHSPDGQTWKPQSSGTERALYSVFGSGPLLIAVGKLGVILLSTDRGQHWQQQKSITPARLNDVSGNGAQWCGSDNPDGKSR